MTRKTKDTPLLMKGPLIKRTIAKRKWKTRRLVGDLTKLHPEAVELVPIDFGPSWKADVAIREDGRVIVKGPTVICPYGQPGDRLWFRETWQLMTGREDGDLGAVVRFRDMELKNCWMPVESAMPLGLTWDKWRPAIYMRRWACRVEGLIYDVKLERVQDISDEDVRAEGIDDLTIGELIEMGVSVTKLASTLGDAGWDISRRYLAATLKQRPDWQLREMTGWGLKQCFAFGWELINGHRKGASWFDNPQVWALSYSVGGVAVR